MRKFVIALALLAPLALQPAPAAARDAGAAPVVRVGFADLDLRSAAGVKALDRRIARAVTALCADPGGTAELSRNREARRCIAATTAALAGQRDRAVAAASAPAMLASRGE